MRILAIALLLTVTIAQASLVERKRAGRGLQDAEDKIGADSFGKPETFKDGEACGVLNAPPCKDELCFPGLVLDTVGWTYLSTIPLFHCLVSPYTPECCELFPGPCLPFNETAPGPGPELGSEPEFPGNYLENWPPQDAPICVPCGGLYQIPCPCEDECVAAPKCSEGLKATNLLAKFLNFGGNSIVMEPVRELRGPLFPSDPSFFQLSASIDLCLPCGGYGQPCCCDSSEFDKFISGRSTIVTPDEDNTLLEFLLENTKTDPNKCLSGCNPYSDFGDFFVGAPLACGADNICNTPLP